MKILILVYYTSRANIFFVGRDKFENNSCVWAIFSQNQIQSRPMWHSQTGLFTAGRDATLESTDYLPRPHAPIGRSLKAIRRENRKRGGWWVNHAYPRRWTPGTRTADCRKTHHEYFRLIQISTKKKNVPEFRSKQYSTPLYAWGLA